MNNFFRKIHFFFFFLLKNKKKNIVQSESVEERPNYFTHLVFQTCNKKKQKEKKNETKKETGEKTVKTKLYTYRKLRKMRERGEK